MIALLKFLPPGSLFPESSSRRVKTLKSLTCFSLPTTYGSSIGYNYNSNLTTRQGKSILIEEVFKTKIAKKRGIDTDGENLSYLRYADDVTLTTNSVEDMEMQLNTLNTQ